MPNPLAFAGAADGLARAGWFLGNGAIGVAYVAAGWSVVTRYRQSDAVGRQQLKWFTYGMAILVVALILEMLAFTLLPPGSRLGELAVAALLLGGSLIPIATAVAILRYGLYEIDVLIDRTFVYGALTAILAGMYAAGIRLFNALFVSATGQQSDAALVLTTLVLATTFTPIKGRLEKVVARRYEGHAHHAAALAGVAAGLSDSALRAMIADVVREELSEERGRRDVHGGGDAGRVPADAQRH